MNKSYVHQHGQTSKCNVNHNLLHYIPSLLTYSYHSKNFFPAWANFPFLLYYPHEHATCYPYPFLRSLLATIQFPATLQQNSLKGLIILDTYNSLAFFSFLWGGGERAVVTPMSCGDLSSQSRDRTHAPCLGSRES